MPGPAKRKGRGKRARAPAPGQPAGAKSAPAPARAPAAAPAPAPKGLRRLLPRSSGEVSLLLAGMNLMLLDFILVQHATVAFDHAEIAVIAFSLSYFSGVSLGYLISDRLSEAAIRRFLPVCLVAQMGLFVGMQPLHHVITEGAGTWAAGHNFPVWIGEGACAALFFLVVTGFATSVYSILLPRVVQGGGDLRRSYSIEIAGSLLGLLLVPVLSAVAHEALLGGYLVTFLALARAMGAGLVEVPAMAVAAIAFLFYFGDWDRAGAAFRYAGYYGWKGDEIVLSEYTPYHKIEVVSSRFGEHRLLLNGKRQFGGDPTRTYAYFVAEYPARLLGKPTVALLGCGSMATVGRIGDFVPSVKIVDLDAEVFEAARTFFDKYNRLAELHNWTFAADDAKHWLASTDETFDLVLHDIPPARSRQIALTYTDEFFRLVKARLTPHGIFSISSLTPFSNDSHYGKRMVKTLASVFDRYFVLVRQGSVYFYGGGPELVVPDQAALFQAVDGNFRGGVQVHTKAEIDAQVQGESTITISNVGDLIYD